MDRVHLWLDVRGPLRPCRLTEMVNENMAIKPSKVLLVVCGSVAIAAAVLLVLGLALESHAFKEAATICFVVMALVSFLP